jgi:hypothetical protein
MMYSFPCADTVAAATNMLMNEKKKESSGWQKHFMGFNSGFLDLANAGVAFSGDSIIFPVNL